MRNTFKAPADATAAKGTRRPSIVRVLGERRFKRGTREFRPTATEQDALTARQYDWAILPQERGLDLLAFALLMATLRDWFVICHAIVPAVC
jgi:hypothetical protein